MISDSLGKKFRIFFSWQKAVEQWSEPPWLRPAARKVTLGVVRDGPLNSTAGGQPGFVSTQWGLLLAADRGEDRQSAWEDLYRTYCYPVYAFIRRRGHPRSAAQDLTHDFFVHLIEKGTLSRADPNRGRFRTFLLGALEYFLVDDARRSGRSKRGGGCHIVFLDDPDAAESEYQLAAPAGATPERLFETRWVAALLGAVFLRLREEMTAAGKTRLFDALKDFIVGDEELSYQRAADSLGISLPALKSSIHRLRGRYGILLREEVARTVADSSSVEEELRHLRAALRAG